MTALPGVRAIDGLRLNGPVWGIDPSTLRMAAGVLKPNGARVERVDFDRWTDAEELAERRVEDAWLSVHTSLKTLPVHKVLSMRQVLAVDALVPWLRALEADHGMPVRIGLEVPMGGTVHFSSFYVIGALYVAMGQVWGANTPPVVELNPGGWKKAATGVGRDHPHKAAKGESKAFRDEVRRRNRAHELARIVSWAQSVGYAGEQEDEAAALGVAVAAGLRR